MAIATTNKDISQAYQLIRKIYKFIFIFLYGKCYAIIQGHLTIQFSTRKFPAVFRPFHTPTSRLQAEMIKGGLFYYHYTC